MSSDENGVDVGVGLHRVRDPIHHVALSRHVLDYRDCHGVRVAGNETMLGR